jgi:hypothetical protein
MPKRLVCATLKWLYDIRRITVIFVVLVLVTFIWGYKRQTTIIEQQHSQLTQIEEIGKNNGETGTLIKDCVYPTGKCFRDSQERTGQAIVTLNDATVAAVSCAQTEKGYEKIKACVTRILKNAR